MSADSEAEDRFFGSAELVETTIRRVKEAKTPAEQFLFLTYLCDAARDLAENAQSHSWTVRRKGLGST